MAKKDGNTGQGDTTQTGISHSLPPDAVLAKRMREVFNQADKPLRTFGICLLNMLVKKRKNGRRTE